MIAPVLVDTGPLVAILIKSDINHQLCLDQLKNFNKPPLTCWPVITEAAWLLRAYPEAIATLLAFFTKGLFELLPLQNDDLPGIGAILTKYKSLKLQLADASLVHLANREGIETVFTLDRRDFGVLRRSGGKRLKIIP